MLRPLILLFIALNLLLFRTEIMIIVTVDFPNFSNSFDLNFNLVHSLQKKFYNFIIKNKKI